MKTLPAIIIAIVLATIIFPGILGDYNPKSATYIPTNSPGSIVSLDDTAFELVPGDTFTVSGKFFAKEPGYYAIETQPFGTTVYQLKSPKSRTSPVRFSIDLTTFDDGFDAQLYHKYDVVLKKCSGVYLGKCMSPSYLSPSVTLSYRIDKPAGEPVIRTPFEPVTIITSHNDSETVNTPIIILKGKSTHADGIKDVQIRSALIEPLNTYVTIDVLSDDDTWEQELPLSEGLNFIYIWSESTTGFTNVELVLIRYDPASGSSGDADMTTYLMWGGVVLVAFVILSRIPLGKQS